MLTIQNCINIIYLKKRSDNKFLCLHYIWDIFYMENSKYIQRGRRLQLRDSENFLHARTTKNCTILTPKFDIPKYAVPLKFQTDKIYQRHNFRRDNANVNAFN